MNKIFKRLAIINVVLFTFFSIITVSCDDIESSVLEKPVLSLSTDPNQPYPLVTKQVKYNEMTASSNVENLVFDGTNTAISLTTLRDSVVIFVEGGPKHYTKLEDFNFFKSLVLSGGNGELIPGGLPNHSFIGMHQMHSINPTVFGSGTFFTPENAEQVNNQTLDMIESVVNWLKSNNKVVFLFGHSNGSLIVQNYMTSGRTNPSYYILTGTRLIPIQDMYDNYPNFVDISYTDGTILNTTNIPEVAKPYFNVLRYLQMNHNKNYMNLLSGNSMLNKTYYSLGSDDEALGRITLEEQNFLINNCPHIIFPGGSHGDASTGVIYALQHFRN